MIIEAVLIGLAGFRIASLLSLEEGPFSIFTRLRASLVPDGELSSWRLQVYLAFQCMWCLTVWTSIIAFLLWELEPWIVVLLAAMTIAMVVDSNIKGSSNGEE